MVAQMALAAQVVPQRASVPRTRSGSATPSRPDSPTETVSRLPLAEQKLIGLARWPDPKYNNETAVAQQAYGMRFSQNCVKLGAQVADRKIPDLQTLWGNCRTWRAAEAISEKPETRAKFALPRSGNGFNEPLGTPISGRYQYIHGKVVQVAADAMRGSKDGIQSAAVERSGAGLMGLLSYYAAHFQCAAKVDGKTIPLTQMLVRCSQEKGQPLKPIGLDLDKPDIVGRMSHTEPQHIQSLMNHAQRIFESMLNDAPSLDASAKIERLGELHWTLTQACPDQRGSAAKAEMSVRALACAIGMEMRPFKAGIAPDLEAFVTPLAAFKSGYADMFVGQAEKAPSRSATPSDR